MSAGLEIRMATEDDLPIILRFIQDLAVYERLRDKCVASLDKLRKTLFTSPPAAEVLIARIDGEPVGFALFFSSYSTFLAQRGIYLEDLFVDPSARGKGVGFALLASLARLSVERDCGRLEWAVLTWNQLAIDFYERLGARPMTDWRTYRLEGDSLTHVADRAPA
jgi:GNAT superfamily N-acetyltransferase